MSEIKVFLIHFVIAGVSSSIAKTITAPFDRIKLLLQNQDSAIHIISGHTKRYTGIIDCFLRLPKEQGWRSFWRGNGVNVIRYIPTQSLNFSFNHTFKKNLTEIVQPETVKGQIIIKFLAGGLAGGLTTSVLYPLDFCQTRIAVDIGSDRHEKQKREFSGLTDCIKTIVRHEGVRALYKGFGVSVLGVVIYRSMYFGLFDGIKVLWYQNAEHTEKPPLLLGLFFAQAATITAGSFSYPLDTVGRRLMMDAGRPAKYRLFKGYFDAFKVIYTSEGIRSFYKGLVANCLRALSGALVLVFYDEVLHYVKWKKIIPVDDRKS